MTEEEKLAALWEIAQEVAELDSTYDDDMGDTECVYCNGDYSYQGKIFIHQDDCIVTKARTLVKERGNT